MRIYKNVRGLMAFKFDYLGFRNVFTDASNFILKEKKKMKPKNTGSK